MILGINGLSMSSSLLEMSTHSFTGIPLRCIHAGWLSRKSLLKSGNWTLWRTALSRSRRASGDVRLVQGTHKVGRGPFEQIDCHKGFPCGSAGKEFICNEGDLGSIPRLGRSPGEGEGYSRILACLISPCPGGKWKHFSHRNFVSIISS